MPEPKPKPKPTDDLQESMMAELAEELGGLYEHLDPKHRERFKAITELNDTFCLDHLQPLHAEYLIACQGLVAACCQDGSPVVEGKAKAQTWAAAIVYTIGWVNFLSDPGLDPTLTSKQVASAFGISVGTMQSRSMEIREGLDIGHLDPTWTLPSMLIHNPYVWLLENEDGVVVDIRHLPREEQQAAFDQGAIPFIPADLEEGMVFDFEDEGMFEDEDEDESLPPDVIGRIFPSS